MKEVVIGENDSDDCEWEGLAVGTGCIYGMEKNENSWTF